MKNKNLEGKKRCICGKTFFGMENGRCVKCGGWLSVYGKNPLSDGVKRYDQILTAIKSTLPTYEKLDKSDDLYIAKEHHIKELAHVIYEILNEVVEELDTFK